MELSAPTQPVPSPITAMSTARYGREQQTIDTATAVVRLSSIRRPHHDDSLSAAVIVSDHGDIVINRLLTAEHDSARSRRTLALDAFAEVYQWAESRDRRTSVYIANTPVRQELDGVAQSFPMALIAHNLYDVIGHRLAPLYEQAGAALEAHRRTTRENDRWMTVYTDASVSLGNQGVGLAVVTEQGRVGSRWIKDIPGSPTLAELLAIEMAITQNPKNHLVIRTDCQRALRLLELTDQELSAEKSTDLVAAVRRIHVATRDRKVKFEWVRGHDGNIFNDAADRVARTMRRSNALGISQSIVDDVLANIRAELIAGIDSQAAGTTAA